MREPTLYSAPFTALLNALYEQADLSAQSLRERSEGLSKQEFARLMTSKADYKEVYQNLENDPLPVSADAGRLLYMLVVTSWAREIVEFGTSFGVSTLHLAAAVRDIGGGRIISAEYLSSKAAIARANLEQVGLSDLVEIREGDALQTLASGLPDEVDLLVLDGAKGLYLDIFGLVKSRLRPGALIVADNAEWCPEYLAYVRSQANGYISVPCLPGLELTMKLP